MAAYELTIKAMSRTDLETAVLEAADWFRPLEARAADGATAHTPSPRPRGRPRNTAGGVPAAAHPPAAGEAQADGEPAAGGDSVPGSLGDAADGDAGALEPETTAQDSVEAGPAAEEGADAGAEEAQAAGEAEAQAETETTGSAADGADAGDGAGQAAADSEDPASDAAGAAQVGNGEDSGPITIEDIKSIAADLIAKKGFQTVKALFAKHGVTKPGATPEEKFPAVMAELKKALA